MLDAIKDIGEMVIKNENRDILFVLIEDVNANGKYNNCVTIILKKDGESVRYLSTELEEYTKNKILKYLYKPGSANGPDISPTAKITEPKKTFDRKILGWFKVLDDKYLKSYLSSEEIKFLENVRKCLMENETSIVGQIEEFRKEIARKENLFITLKFKEDDGEKYIGDFDVFRKLFKEKIDKKDLQIFAEDHYCSICKEKKPVVIGNLDTYAFYTIDKPGFITGGFKEENAWKNFPVCLDCKLALEEGKKYLENYLKFNFAGLRYHLIPKFLFGSDQTTKDVIETLTNSAKVNMLRKSEKTIYLASEDEILGYLKDAKDNLILNFLFIKQEMAAERILLLIEDVFPSRIKEIFNAKKAVDDLFKGDEQFTFWTIRTFFTKSDKNKRDYDLDKYFLDVTDRIFKDRPLDNNFVFKFLMREISRAFVYDEFFDAIVRRGLMFVYFLEQLDLIKMEEEKMEERIFDKFFEQYGKTFEKPEKRALFLLGALTELLLRKQYSEKGTQPFMKSLKGLRLDEEDFVGLLPKVQNKLEEYDSFDKGKKLLAQEASYYLLKAGRGWKMSVDEMNFYFASGMNLVEEITKIIYGGKKQEEVLE